MQVARKVLVGTAAATFLLYQIPYGALVVYPLLLLSTVVHELGHGLTAELLGGTFVAFRMEPDGSGLAMYTASSAGAVAAGGLCGPPVVAAVMLAIAARRRAARVALAVFGAAMALATALYVRGTFGVVFTLTVAAAALAIAAFTRPRTAQLALVVVAVQLALSVYARADYLFTATAGGGPSDTTLMAGSYGGSYRTWGLACAALSLAVLAIGGAIFWRATAATRRSRG
jgi:hypothetical protein